MAVSFISAAQTSTWGTTSPKTISATVQVGDTIIVCGGSENNTDPMTTPSDGVNTYTLQSSVVTSGFGATYIWTATASTATTLTITVDLSSGAGSFGGVVYVFRGSGGIGAVASAHVSPGAPSVSLTTTVANSMVVAFNDDAGLSVDGSTRTWRTVNSITPTSGNGLEKVYQHSGSTYTTYSAYWNDAGAAGANTYGLSAPTGQGYALIAIEIKNSATTANADSALAVTATETATANIVANADSTLAVTATETATANIVANADAALAVTVSLTATASSSTPATLNADAALAVSVSLAATASSFTPAILNADAVLAITASMSAVGTTIHYFPEFGHTVTPAPEEIPEYLLTTGIPPQEVIDALTSGVIVVKRRVEIYEADAVTPFDIPFWNGRLVDGSITIDGTRDERRMCDFQLDNTDFELGLNPYSGFWYDKILKAFWGIEYNNPRGSQTFWEMQVGEFMIDRIDEDYFPNICKVTGRDYTKKCLLTNIANAIQFSNQTPVEAIIGALGANAGIKKFRLPYTGLTFQDDIVFDAGTARWEIMKKLVNSVGFEVYFTADGYLTMRAYQDPVLSPLVWTFQPGPTEDGSLVTYNRSSDDALVKNHVIVIGATTTDDLGFSTTAFGEARNDDPSSPTNIDRIGDRVDTFKSDYITDPVQAQAVAEMRLRVSSLEEFSISFSSMILPWVDGNDIIDIINPKETIYVPARFLMSNYTLPFVLGAMTGTGKRVTIVGTTQQLGVH